MGDVEMSPSQPIPEVSDVPELVTTIALNRQPVQSIDRIYYLTEYKNVIVELCHKNTAYIERVKKLQQAWNCVLALISSSTKQAEHTLLYWVLRHTLHLMLRAEWTKLLSQDTRNEIRMKIEQSLVHIKAAPNSVNRCQYILQNMDDPWGDERLLSVLHGKRRILTQSELDYLTAERGCMIVLRLRKLCETKCDEMAFTLCSKTLLALRSVAPDHLLRKSTSILHLHFIFDIYLCLVHKFIGVDQFIDEVNDLELLDKLLLIRRNLNTDNESSRIKRLRIKLATSVADITIATLMTQDLTNDIQPLYCAILEEWLKINQKTPVMKLRDVARKLFSEALSPKHLHLACSIIKEMNVAQWRELLLELYVRVITGELNELELLKSEKSCSANVIIESETALSYRYLQLADLLETHHPLLTHECILTAFSLDPTEYIYNLVKCVAYAKQQAILTNQTIEPLSTNLPNSSRHHLKDAYETNNINALSTINITMDSIETIDLPDEIRLDLSVLLSSPRVKFLSWLQTWPQLEINCQKLLKPGGKLEIVCQSLAVANDHLKYLNLDYEQFRDLPVNDGPGIEKGYEIYAESDENYSNNDTDSDENDGINNMRRRRPATTKRQSRQPSKQPRIFSKHQLNDHVTTTQTDHDLLVGNATNSQLSYLQSAISGLESNIPSLPLMQYNLEDYLRPNVESSHEFDDLFRTIYIQQIYAQFQLSKKYTAALRQQVIPHNTSSTASIDDTCMQQLMQFELNSTNQQTLPANTTEVDNQTNPTFSGLTSYYKTLFDSIPPDQLIWKYGPDDTVPTAATEIVTQSTTNPCKESNSTITAMDDAKCDVIVSNEKCETITSNSDLQWNNDTDTMILMPASLSEIVKQETEVSEMIATTTVSVNDQQVQANNNSSIASTNLVASEADDSIITIENHEPIVNSTPMLVDEKNNISTDPNNLDGNRSDDMIAITATVVSKDNELNAPDNPNDTPTSTPIVDEIDMDSGDDLLVQKPQRTYSRKSQHLKQLDLN